MTDLDYKERVKELEKENESLIDSNHRWLRESERQQAQIGDLKVRLAELERLVKARREHCRRVHGCGEEVT